ncbi:putative abortive infection protein [Leucobacter sp. Psy1]|uniref:CPBP family intramembrane glutamic endopeptidase n=1 Tax=Leucobacter sp. Psy1 TaxID=2875729 RepID=UPI001CD2568B|nr:type II CAAX endopeptidase family protein [Leucobacter sp. Psy1]UBH05005.1 putative abortive infection protein [Leucobacter sp. Psy1]
MKQGSSSVDTAAQVRGPGWPEILAGGAAYVASIGLVVLLLPLISEPVVQGNVALLVSGLMGIIALAVAVLIRIRGLEPFGFRRARPLHLGVGAGLGVLAYGLGIVAALVYTALTGQAENVQEGYQAAAAGGWLSLALAIVAGALITPLGEEGFFRGVLANALLARYGAWVGVLVSAAVFAVAHGINPILPVAFVVGVMTALLFRWSGSIWPGVVLHGVNNAVALIIPLMVGVADA